MEYDYYENTPFTVYALMDKIQRIISDNPDVDFTKVGIIMNQEYSCCNVVLDKWNSVVSGKKRVGVSLE